MNLRNSSKVSIPEPGFEPCWAPFSGFSLLFDNPGHSTTQVGEFLKVSCSSQSGGELDLYSRLKETIEELDRNTLVRTFFFCPLPPSSYHVTVWDGVNAENISSVRVKLRAEWTEFLKRTPNSLRTPPSSMAFVLNSALVKRPLNPIRFKFDRLAIWGNQVLVARLLPIGKISESSLRDLCAARKTLYEASQRELGIGPSHSFSPHVSLGYFANQEHRRQARALAKWTEHFGKNLKNTTITYSSVGVYAYTDMASFFRSEVPSSGAVA